MSVGNQKTDGNKGTNTPWQMTMIRLLRYILEGTMGLPDINDLHKVTDVITGSSPVELFPAIINRRVMITDLLVTNADATNGTWVEFRETNANGALLWKGFAKADGGGFIQPNMKKPFMAAKGKSVVVVCLTSGAEVVVCATGHNH